MTMSSPVPPPSADTAVRPRGLAVWWPELVGAATALLFAFAFLDVVPGPDVAWQLWIAHQIRMGARLYVDIVETNPPLWFWEAVPLDGLAARTGIASHMLLVAAVGLAASVSVVVAGRLLRHIPVRWRAALLVYAALTLLLMPLIDTGQREQLALICAFPYVVLAAARREGRAVHPLLACAIGGAACLGLALKHYFLIAPVLIELGLLVARRRAYRPLRPETVAVAMFCALYAVAVFAVAPDFLTRMVALNRIAYAGVGATGWADMIRPIQVFWVIAAAPWLVQPRLLRRAPHASAMALAALGFGLGWLIQFKGFPYHSIPVSGFLMLTLAFFVVENRDRLGFLTCVTVPTILLIPLGFTAWYGPFRNDFAAIVAPVFEGVQPEQGVAFVSDQAIFSWPLSLYRPAPYPSRQYGMWILRAVAADHGRTPALAAIGRQVVEETAQDYRCAQPVRIAFSRKPVFGVQLEDMFFASASFADLMRHYRRLGRYRIFDVYALDAPFTPPPASRCRRTF